MPDWTLPMQQTFEYYEVNPNTWKDEKNWITLNPAVLHATQK